MSQKGFTLLELIIVMVLSGLLLGLTTMLFGNGLPSARFNATTREIVATIRQTRALARNTGTDQVLVLDLDGRTYGIEGGRLKAIPERIAIRVYDPVFGEVHSGKYQIVFRATGSIEGGTVVLSYRAKTVRIHGDPIVGAVAERS